jgi:hypothetical protein
MATTEVTGIFQTPIIVRSAIIKSLQELREDPTLIEDALACLVQDDLTAARYGEKTVAQCVEWFTKTNIPVKLGLSLTQLTSPCISVELSGGDETEATLGDVNYTPSEEDPRRPGHYRQLASVHSRESVNVIVMVQGEVEYLLFLSSLLRFAVLRHKEDLFDDRGFARMTWGAGVFGSMPEAPGRENFFANTVRVTGYVRHVWPVPLAKDQPDTAISSVPFGPRVAPVAQNTEGTATSVPATPSEPGPAGANPFDPANWLDRDIISGKKT